MSKTEKLSRKERKAQKKNRKAAEQAQKEKTVESQSNASIEKSQRGDHTTRKSTLPTLMSTQMWSPIRDIKDGVIITKDNEFIQVLEISPINFLLRTQNEQDAIASAFASIIKIMPSTVHLKVLARKADVEEHIQEIHHYMETETNAKCLSLQQEMIDLIHRNAIEGVSRRFYLSYQYEMTPGLQRPTWKEILSSLDFTGDQIEDMLNREPCENSRISPPHDSYYTLGILYEIMCRKEAETKPLNDKIQEVINRHAANGDLKSDDTIPVNDFIAPASIDPSNFKHIAVDGKYYAFGYVPGDSYQTRCIAGWLTRYICLDEGIDIDFWISKEPIKSVQQKLIYALRANKSSLYHTSDTNADYDDMLNKVQAGYYLREGLSADQDFCYFAMMVTIVADSAEVLKQKIRWTRDRFIASGLQLRMLNFRHMDAFKASMPLCKPDKNIFKKARRNSLSGDLGAAYPFTSFEINDKGGFMVGINRSNQSPVFINPYYTAVYENANMALLGTTGAGKTYTLLCMAYRLREEQVQTIIIAPKKGEEYYRACKAIGGTYIDLSPGSMQNINIMEIRKTDTTNMNLLNGSEMAQSSILAKKIQQLHILVSLIAGTLTPGEHQALDEALIRTYGKKGITNKNRSLLDPQNPGNYKQMPTLGDLDEELKSDRRATKVREALGIYVHGSAKSFNAQTNVNLDNKFVVIDVSRMTKAMLPVAIFIATDFVYDVIKADRTRRKAVFFDELWALIGAPAARDAAEFVLEIFKTVRGYNTMAVAATQDLNDFYALDGGVYGKGILSNAKIKLVMKLTDAESKLVADILSLSDEEKNSITKYERGQGLLIANRNHMEIKIVASMQENELFTTDPTELSSIVERLKRDSTPT